MPLVHLSDMINHASRHNYAVGAFGVNNLHFLKGIIQAAEERRAPVVLNMIESHFENHDFELLLPAVIAAARRTEVPVAINFDHGTSLASAERAIRAGCNGVMVDTSALLFSDNLWQTRDVVTKAHACGVTVEGELGYVPGVEGEDAKHHPGELTYTSAAEAAGFVERTGVDCLAVSIGTVHGRMKGVPKLDYARLAKIKEAVAVPLVIHGGTGLSDDQFRRLIANGVAKINYYTALADVANRRIKANIAGERKGGQNSPLSGVSDAVREEVERCIHLWGCSGRAAEVLAQCRLWHDAEHIVFYNVSETLSESEIATTLREGKRSLEAIPGVRSIRTSRASQHDGEYRYSLSIGLASKTALEILRNHPTYQRFANTNFWPMITDHIALDLEES
ncbi:MAG: class II fructose-bisphosphate aldolase [Nitrosomonadales bacterium]|nr:class II fructose-bisphosphate aldolase [Nitrosomonadales bacterium]